MLPVFAPGRSAPEADRALRSACQAEADARRCAVLWFGDILTRRLYRDLGHASMQQYARCALGFSETRTSDFMHLVRKLDRLPAVREALPDIGYTKARQIVRVASPRTEARWVDLARNSSRRELADKVKQVTARARKKPAAALFEEPETLAAEVPVRVGIEFTPEQHARWEGLWEKLAKRGVTGGRAEMLLDALACKLEEATGDKATASKATAPRGAVPPVQVHVHRCPDCGRAETGGQRWGRADTERLTCDAAISVPGQRNTTTIPPRTRRQVLARDRHRCQAPGCGHTRFLEVHHREPRERGGTNDPANLITLCGACHRLWHERRARE